MESVVITLRHKEGEADLELPTRVPINIWLPIVCEQLGWATPGRDATSPFQFTGRVSPTGRTLSAEDSLASAGVSSGFILNLDLRQPIQRLETSPNITGPYLVNETGQVYPVSGRSTLIGRPDPPRNPPDIDLTDLDYQRVTSRRHAQIWQDQSHRYWVKDLRSTNGVLVNGQPLNQGQRIRLQEGSRIQFGHGGPTLVFHQGSNPA